MKIAQVTPLFSGRGGVQTYVRGVATALAERGHEVRVFAVGDSSRVVEGVTGGFSVSVLNDESWKVFGRFPVTKDFHWLRGELRRFGGVVHAHQPFATTSIAAVMGTRPTVLSPHLHRPPYAAGISGARRRLQLRLVTRQFDGLAFDSLAEKILFSEFSSAKAPFAVARPGVSVQAAGRTGEGRQDLVLVVGALLPHKRPDLALRSAIAAGVGARCRIVGEGPLRQELELLCRQNGLDPKEVVLGSVSELRLEQLVSSSRVVMAMSVEEAYGISLLDGIAGGAVPLASDIPSHREIVELTQWSDENLVSLEASVAEIASQLVACSVAEHLQIRERTIPTWADAAIALERLYEVVAG